MYVYTYNINIYIPIIYLYLYKTIYGRLVVDQMQYNLESAQNLW